MNRLVKVWLVAAVFLILGLLFIFFPITISSLRPGVTIKQFQLDSLVALEEKALQYGEYPVGALVIYKDSIIGSGFNTFREKNEPMGHAEINAIEDVFQSMHYLDFRVLDRDSLVLITSYEPCPMCKGVINHLDIRRVYYLQPKRIRYRLKYGMKDLSFYLKIRRIKRPKNQ
jgi:tRNA(Arg) A34 adenosine deaminase TadA